MIASTASLVARGKQRTNSISIATHGLYHKVNDIEKAIEERSANH